jgi:lia operon protein LiaF
MGNRNRNTAIVLIAAGVFLLLGSMIGFSTVAGILIVWLAVHKLRTGEQKSGYLLLVLGLLFLVNGNLSVLMFILLFSLGYFILKSKQVHRGENYLQKHNLLESIRWNTEPWELKNLSVWSVIGEIRMDLSLAVTNEPETTIVLQGIIGDIDLIVPEDIGVSVESMIWIGQTSVNQDRESGLCNKLQWKSPNYDTSEQRVNLLISYVIGDLDMKVL